MSKSKRINQAIGAFLLSGAIVNDATISNELPFLTVSKVLFLLGALALFAAGINGKTIKKPDIYITVYAILITLPTLLAHITAPYPNFLKITTSLTIGCISFILIRNSKTPYKYFLNTFCIWITISVTIGLIQSTIGILFFTDRIFHSSILKGTFRASGFMSDPNYFSLICLLALAFSNDQKRTTRRIFALICLLGIVLSGSRAGLLLSIPIIYLKTTSFRISPIGIAKTSIAVIILIGLTISLRDHLPNSISRVFSAESYTDNTTKNSLTDRLSAINAGIQAFTDSPLIGYGTGNLVNHPENTNKQVSHNTYIEILAENGAIGIIAFLTAILRSSRLDIVNKDPTKSKTHILVLIVFLGMSLTLVTHYSRIFFFVLALLSIRTGSPHRKPSVSINS